MNFISTPSATLEGATAPVPTAPRIGYDARFSLGEYRGMGRYLRRFIRPVASQSLGFAAGGESDAELRLSARGFRSYPLWEQFSLARRAGESHVEFLVAPYNTAPLRLPAHVKLILIVHDFIYLRSTSDLPLSRSNYQNFGRLYRRFVVPRAIRCAHRIVCVSKYGRKELLQRFRVDPSLVSVIPNTVDASWFALSRPATPSDYILCVSGEAPNKNLDKAIAAFAAFCRMSRNQTRMLVAGVKRGFHSHFAAIAAHHGIGNRVRFLDYVSDEQLQGLFANATAFLFPSREEGFGIPLLEALACGVPAVTSNASSIPEVAGDVPLYFHPDAVHEMAEQLCAVTSNPHLQLTMSRRGRERAQRFHPDVVDTKIADFWSQLLSSNA